MHATDTAVCLLLLCHELLITRKQLLTVALRQTLGTSLSFQELLILASRQVTVVTLGGQ